MRIVVTGNIGCGKSTVCKALLEHMPGYTLVSVDDLARGLYQNAAYLDQLSAWFGTTDRKEVARQVFADEEKRAAVEDLSVKLLTPAMDEAFSRENVIIEFPLFYEKPFWLPEADYVLALGCDPAIQWERVKARDNLSRGAYERVVAAQLPTETKRSWADAYIDTGVPLDQVLRLVADLASFWRPISSTSPASALC